MWEPSREEAELFKLLDDERLEEAVEKLHYSECPGGVWLPGWRA